ncbi:S-layer homology domain-containing protein [Cohnella yongneupensis]|uniref:S-layer homology domain-containing protein n=1 Tax=Cohnella yongneupensis TaxID=425006 RepID=A0ABW0QXM8_9BACL
MLRKWFVSYMALCLIFACVAISPAFAVADASYDLSIDKTTVYVNETFNVTVRGRNMHDVYGYEVVVSYDSSKLSFESANNALPKSKVTEQDGFSISPLHSGNKITFAFTKIGTVPGVSGAEPVSVFTFKSIGKGDASIKIESIKTVGSDLKSEKKWLEDTVMFPVYVRVSFRDLEHVSWAREGIEALAARGIIVGNGHGLFEPMRQVTRAEFIKMLMNSIEMNDDKGKSTFTDVKSGAWYENAIAAAQKLGIVEGRPDGSFGVEDPITRQDMAVIVYKLSMLLNKDLGATSGAKPFSDQANVSDYATEAVEAMRLSGLMNGTGNGKFEPKAHTTRAEAAVFIYRLLGRLH